MAREPWARRKLARPATARGRFSRRRERCASMCRAAAEAAPESFAPLEKIAVARAACAGRKRLTYAFQRAWPTEDACASPAKVTLERWARLQAICIYAWWSAHTNFSNAAETICTPRCQSRLRKRHSARKWKYRRLTAARWFAFLPARTAARRCG